MTTHRRFFALFAVLVLFRLAPHTSAAEASPADGAWLAARPLRTVEDAVEAFPARTARLYAGLDLDRAGLEAVKAAHEEGDPVAAGEALLAYYAAASPVAERVTPPPPEPGDDRLDRPDAGAELLLRGLIEHRGRRLRIRTRPEGGVDWEQTGPGGDGTFTHRLTRLTNLDNLARAWRRTGNPVYTRLLDRILLDWLVQNPRRDEAGAVIPRRPGRMHHWSHISLGVRANHWPALFYDTLPADEIAPATRLLWLAAIHETAEALYSPDADADGDAGNGLLNNLSALTQIALHFPAFRDAEAWFRYADDGLLEQIDEQVYPDGAQFELTSGYHLVCIRHFERRLAALRRFDRETGDRLPATVEKMYSYLVYIMKPDGALPQNNDADHKIFTPWALRHSEDYGRPDWRYIATHGREGERPDGPPSRAHPWAGQMVFRSGWGADAQWSWFDVGPAGHMHQHADKLHLSVSDRGRALLIDTGRFAYSGEGKMAFADGYGRHTRGHNTILFDDMGQRTAPMTTETPVAEYRIGDGWDFAVGHYRFGYGGRGIYNDPTQPEIMNARALHDRRAADCAHSRAVLRVDGAGWLVFDRVATDRPRRVEALWHYHPACTVAVDGRDVVSVDEGVGNLRITPIGPVAFAPTLYRGVERPMRRGWYSEENQRWEPATVASHAAGIDGAAVFAWFLSTAVGVPDAPAVEWLDAPDGVARVRVVPAGGAPFTATAVLSDRGPVLLDDGRRLDARLLLERDGRDPEVAAGTLRRGATVLARHDVPAWPALVHQLRRTEPEAALTGVEPGDAPVAGRWIVPLDLPAAAGGAEVTHAVDAGAWTLKASAVTRRGADALAFDIREEGDWPLPVFTLEAAWTDPGGGRTRTMRRTLLAPADLEALAAKRRPDVTLGADGFEAELFHIDPWTAPSWPTRARVAHDADRLIVTLTCHEAADCVRKLDAVERDGPAFLDDSVELFVQKGMHDGAPVYWQVAVNAAGVVFDSRNRDAKQNLPDLAAEVRDRDGGGYVAEIAVPWAALGGRPAPGEAFGLLFGRTLLRGGPEPGRETQQWPLTMRGHHAPARFARFRLP